ncbi:MAG: hypothetical protein IPG56_20260 [Caulobacteraceae bacterium]|nr:hypothetical protein [Caulobacteraceae bacterium]
MEDVDLVRRIGRRRLRTLACAATTSAAAGANGWLKRNGTNIVALRCSAALARRVIRIASLWSLIAP